jgi:hypothetical protein
MSPQSEAAVRKAIVALILVQFAVFTALLQPMSELARVLVFSSGTAMAYVLYKLHEALYPD